MAGCKRFAGCSLLLCGIVAAGIAACTATPATGRSAPTPAPSSSAAAAEPSAAVFEANDVATDNAQAQHSASVPAGATLATPPVVGSTTAVTASDSVEGEGATALAGGMDGAGPATAPPVTLPAPSPAASATSVASAISSEAFPPASATVVAGGKPAGAQRTAVSEVRPALEQGAGKNTRLWRARGLELADGELSGVVRGQNDLRLAGEPQSYALSATLSSRVYEAAFPFDNAVLSWNAAAPAGTGLRFELRARIGDAPSGRWTPWYTMGNWSSSGGASIRRQSDDSAEVDTDTLVLRRAADAWQYRVVFSSDGMATPTLSALGIVYADLRSPLSGPPVAPASGWARELPVPAYSQLEEDDSVARVICSPTSLAMLINYYGGKKTVAEVAKGVRDSGTGIFGNWPLNTAYAGTLGLDAYVDRFYSMDQVASRIADGQPLAASIRYGPGELPGAPLYQTSGHLIVIRGFTPDGNVIVNDPFGQSASQVRRVLRRGDLEKVWLRSGGIVYLLDRLSS